MENTTVITRKVDFNIGLVNKVIGPKEALAIGLINCYGGAIKEKFLNLPKNNMVVYSVKPVKEIEESKLNVIIDFDGKLEVENGDIIIFDSLLEVMVWLKIICKVKTPFLVMRLILLVHDDLNCLFSRTVKELGLKVENEDDIRLIRNFTVDLLDKLQNKTLSSLFGIEEITAITIAEPAQFCWHCGDVESPILERLKKGR